MKERRASEPFQPCILLDGALIPEAILKDPTLSAGARLLWTFLAEYQGKSVEFFPLEEMLAVPLGVKVRQLQPYIKELENYTRRDPPEAFPLIEVKRTWVEKERKTRNIYSLLRRPFLAVSRMPEESQLAGGGNAQSFAYQSEGEAQYPAAGRSPISNEGGGVGPGAVARPAIPSEPEVQHWAAPPRRATRTLSPTNSPRA